MMKSGDPYAIGIRFDGLKFFRFGFIEKADYHDEDLSVQLSVDIKDDELVRDGTANVFVKVTVLFVIDNTKEIVANIEVVSLFVLEGIRDDAIEDGRAIYPERLLTTLVSLAISTTRGAILAKGAGSFLERMPLPIVNPKEFVERRKSKEASNNDE